MAKSYRSSSSEERCESSRDERPDDLRLRPPAPATSADGDDWDDAHRDDDDDEYDDVIAGGGHPPPSRLLPYRSCVPSWSGGVVGEGRRRRRPTFGRTATRIDYAATTDDRSTTTGGGGGGGGGVGLKKNAKLRDATKVVVRPSSPWPYCRRRSSSDSLLMDMQNLNPY